MLERLSKQQHCQRQSAQTLHDSRRGKAEDVTTVWHICRMNDQRLVKIVMLGMVEWRVIYLVDDRQEDGLTTSETGADLHCQRLFNWRLTEKWREEETLASTAHRGHEF